jgi:hypothetical protein
LQCERLASTRPFHSISQKLKRVCRQLFILFLQQTTKSRPQSTVQLLLARHWFSPVLLSEFREIYRGASLGYLRVCFSLLRLTSGGRCQF